MTGDTPHECAGNIVDESTAVMTLAEAEAINTALTAALERRQRHPPRPEFGGQRFGGELRREALAYARGRTVEVTNWMARLEIDRDLTGLEMLGVTRAATAGREWSHEPAGQPVITLPIWAGECCLDILALDPHNASRWWTQTDIVPVLAPEEIARCAILDEPLDIHASPLEWLRAGARGTVILDWRSVSFWLAGVRRFLCFDDMTAKRLDRGLRNPPQKFEIKLAKEPINVAA